MHAARTVVEVHYRIGAVERPTNWPLFEIDGLPSEFHRAQKDFRAFGIRHGDQALRAFERDFELVAHINADSVVDPSDNGPLGPIWPEGAPDWLTDLNNQ